MNEQPDMGGWSEIGVYFLGFVIFLALGNGVGVLLGHLLSWLPGFVARLLTALL